MNNYELMLEDLSVAVIIVGLIGFLYVFANKTQEKQSQNPATKYRGQGPPSIQRTFHTIKGKCYNNAENAHTDGRNCKYPS